MLSGPVDGTKPYPLNWGQDKPEPEVVVAIAWRVTVAIRRPRVPRVVVPAAAAINAIRASGQHPMPIDHISS